MDMQPEYSDGTYAWAVDAVKSSGKQQRITTTYVRAPTAKRAAEAGVYRLRNMIRARGHKGGWRVSARAAHASRDLKMVEIKR